MLIALVVEIRAANFVELQLKIENVWKISGKGKTLQIQPFSSDVQNFRVIFSCSLLKWRIYVEKYHENSSLYLRHSWQKQKRQRQ